MLVGCSFQALHAAEVLKELQNSDRHRTHPGEEVTSIKQLGRGCTAHADGAAQHQAGREQVRAQPVTTLRDKQIAVAQEGKGAVRGSVGRNGEPIAVSGFSHWSLPSQIAGTIAGPAPLLKSSSGEAGMNLAAVPSYASDLGWRGASSHSGLGGRRLNNQQDYETERNPDIGQIEDERIPVPEVQPEEVGH